MITRTHMAVLVGIVCCAQVSAQSIRDVPQVHWAHTAVIDVIAHGVMSAPGGKFDGARKVTRAELAVILERLARSLEKQPWTIGHVGSLPNPPRNEDWRYRLRRVRQFPSNPPRSEDWRVHPITRYDLASAIDNIAHYVSQGLPAARTKVFGKSDALPPLVEIKTIPRTRAAYSSLVFLASRRMIFPGSFFLKPGDKSPVTGEQAAQALAELCIGLNDRWTDEPQNRPEIAPPPGNGDAKTPPGGH